MTRQSQTNAPIKALVGGRGALWGLLHIRHQSRHHHQCPLHRRLPHWRQGHAPRRCILTRLPLLREVHAHRRHRHGRHRPCPRARGCLCHLLRPGRLVSRRHRHRNRPARSGDRCLATQRSLLRAPQAQAPSLQAHTTELASAIGLTGSCCSFLWLRVRPAVPVCEVHMFPPCDTWFHPHVCGCMHANVRLTRHG